MTRPQRIILAGALLLALSPLAAAASDEARRADASAHAPTPLPVLTVRVTALDGMGPDDIRHTLFRDAAGVELPYRRLARIAQLVDADRSPGPGGYYQLRAELANDLQSSTVMASVSLRVSVMPVWVGAFPSPARW